jgi:ribose transport system substrate-binding protein
VVQDQRIRVSAMAATAIVVAAFIAGCGGTSNASSNSDSGASVSAASGGIGHGKRIYAVAAQDTNNWVISLRCGAQAAAKAYGADLAWRSSNGVSVANELDALNTAVQQKAAGVVLLPFSPTAFIGPVRTLMGQGVPVVTVGTYLEHPFEYQTYANDDAEGGKEMGEYIGKALHGKGTVGFISYGPGTNSNATRLRAAQAALKEFPGIKELPPEYDQLSSTKAANLASALIQSNPDLTAIFATAGPSAVGVASAIEATHSKVKLFGYDADPPVIALVRQGRIAATVAQSPYRIGYTATEVILKYLAAHRHGGSVARAPQYSVQFPNQIITPETVNTAQGKKLAYATHC